MMAPEVPTAFTPEPSQAGSTRLGVTPMSSSAQRRKAQGWCVASLRGFCSMVQIPRPQEHGARREGQPGRYHTRALAGSSSRLVGVETQR